MLIPEDLGCQRSRSNVGSPPRWRYETLQCSFSTFPKDGFWTCHCWKEGRETLQIIVIAWGADVVVVGRAALPFCRNVGVADLEIQSH
jgi:hypothetical protein